MDETEADSLVLLLLVDDTRVWADDEIVREIDIGTHHVTDSLNRLHGAGLIHRNDDGYSWAARAAIKAHELEL